MFGAVAWSACAVILIFVVVPGLWETLLGRSGAVFGALGALAAAVWGSGRMMRWADAILQGPEYKEPAATLDLEVDVPRDWHTYNAEIARSKRWAFYRRTRQFDRLAELEATMKRGRPKGVAGERP
jgi:hypothetical protein